MLRRHHNQNYPLIKIDDEAEMKKREDLVNQVRAKTRDIEQLRNWLLPRIANPFTAVMESEDDSDCDTDESERRDSLDPVHTD